MWINNKFLFSSKSIYNPILSRNKEATGVVPEVLNHILQFTNGARGREQG